MTEAPSGEGERVTGGGSEDEFESKLHRAVAACTGDHAELRIGQILRNGAIPSLLIEQVEHFDTKVCANVFAELQGLGSRDVGSVDTKHACCPVQARRVAEGVRHGICAADKGRAAGVGPHPHAALRSLQFSVSVLSS